MKLELNIEEKGILEQSLDVLINAVSSNLPNLKAEEKIGARDGLKKCLELQEKIVSLREEKLTRSK